MDRLYRSEIPLIAESLKVQKTAERYVDMREHWAFLASVITNGFSGLIAGMSSKRRKPKMVKPEDFIDKDFTKLFEGLFPAKPKKLKATLVQDAQAKGLKGPWSKVGESE